MCDNLVSLRILVVDDNLVNRMCTARALENRRNSTVDTVSSGTEAVEHWEDADVILMDVHMPDMDGVEAARRIRKKSADLVIIGYSTKSEEEDRCKEAGMDDFLVKPMSPLELNAHIDYWEKHLREKKTL